MEITKEKLMQYAKHPGRVVLWLGCRGWLPFVSDEAYIKLQFKEMFSYPVDLTHPRTLNEKLQWLKLHDRKPEYTTMVDKYAAKAWIAERIGGEYIIPTLGVWDHFDDIDFDALPDRFILKCTHDSGSVIRVKDKARLDRPAARKKLEKALRRNWFYVAREWAYKDVPPRIIAEEYLVDESGTELKDYKLFCFNGKPEYVEVDFNREIQHKLNPYDFDWNPLNFCDSSKNDYTADIRKPERLLDMYKIAEMLSKNMKFLRVDFYSIGSRIYIGELTLYPGAGFIQFDPPSVDRKYGDLLDLGDEA